MTAKRISGLVLTLITAMVLPVAAMEVNVHVQDATTTDPIEAAYVRYIFNPGTAVADTADGYTDVTGDMVLYHDVVSSVNDVPSFAVFRPYPNPAGSTAYFDVQGPDKAATALSFALYDLRGRLVGKGNVGAGAVVLPRPLASGSYLYRLKEGPSVKATGKLGVIGRLEKVEFKASPVSTTSKTEADPVDILIQATGYEDHAESQVLAEGTHFTTFNLNQISGGIFVTSTPVGARIIIDGIDTGQVTPAVVEGITEDEAEVSLELDTYLVHPTSYTVLIVPGEIIELPADTFAFRSIRTVMIESFSNVSSPPCPEMADNLWAMAAQPEFNSDRVLYMEFHVSWPQLADPFFLANPQENGDRFTLYQVPGVPDLYTDGVRLADALDAVALENSVLADLESDPGFLIDVVADFSTSSVPVSVTLIPLRDVDLTGHVLFVAIYEDEIVIEPAPGINGQTVFHHVFRDRVDNLPILGTLIGGVPQQFDLMLSRGSGDPENFVALAFVQNDNNQTILQAGSTAVTHDFPAALFFADLRKDRAQEQWAFTDR